MTILFFLFPFIEVEVSGITSHIVCIDNSECVTGLIIFFSYGPRRQLELSKFAVHVSRDLYIYIYILGWLMFFLDQNYIWGN
jgi:hypothetical protein